MQLPELAAIGAALCWSVASVFSMEPNRYLGPLAFVRIRMTIVVVILLLVLVVQGTFNDQLLSLPPHSLALLGSSGVVGIWIGDILLFICMDRIGPRRAAILFATNAPMQVFLGVFLLGETLSLGAFIGCVLVVSGTYLAIVFGKHASQIHQWEDIKGPLITAVLLGLGAALGQAIGSLIAKPVMESGASAISATAVRGAAAVAMMWLSLLLGSILPLGQQKALQPLNTRIFVLTTLSGVLAMAMGMGLLLYALKNGDLGMTAILSSTSTTLMLPVLWLITKERPALFAWVGALLAVAGIASIQLA